VQVSFKKALILKKVIKMNEELNKKETPIAEAVEQEVIPAKKEELSDTDLENVAGGSNRRSDM
jgi:hypothetical protein